MRLTFAATMRDTYSGIADAAERMIKYQRQVSTGIKVAQPSDDPSATATTISEKAAKASYEQYVQAGDSAESRLAVADTLLSDIIDKLGASRTAILSVQGSETTDAQREKIERFRLAPLFDLILIEGELGFGKPDERIYRLALTELAAAPRQTWMIGDNLEFDVGQPQKLGITGIWVNATGAVLPADGDIYPDLVIRRLAELRECIRLPLSGGRMPVDSEG